VTKKRKIVSGGKSEESATAKALALLGDYVPEPLKPGAKPPTVQQAVESWLQANAERWNTRTRDHYGYQSKRLIDALGARPVSSITPNDIARIDVSTLSRGEQKKIRTIVRGVFRHVEAWLYSDAESLARAVKVSGGKDSDPAKQVTRGDIPTTEYVQSLIASCYTTLNIFTRDNGREVAIAPLDFNKGVPDRLVLRMRRGIPRHYKRLEEHRKKEDEILKSRFRQFGLLFALAAGGGLRIGELLALRVRHFFPDASSLSFTTSTLDSNLSEDDPLFLNYVGRVDVVEQASQASKGAIVLSAPKMARERAVWLPPILPAGTGQTFIEDVTTRQRATRIVPRFEDPRISMWSMTRKEALSLWMKEQPPLVFMLWLRLTELWESNVVQSQKTEDARFRTFQSLLLFPTRNPLREQDGQFQPNIKYASTWKHDVRIVRGTGGYQSTTNLVGRYLNVVFDYVSEELGGYYPSHRVNKKEGRKGWTLHGLRHYAISSWLASPIVSLPEVTTQAGHKDINFTLERYGHLMDDRLVRARGFET
jgi:integrase